LREIASLLALEEGGQSFRVRAFENAVRAAEAYPHALAAMSERQLAALKGIGSSIASTIHEYVESGRIGRLEELRERHPPSLLELERVPGLGPKKVELLYEQLGVRTIDDLRRAVEAQQLRGIRGLGAKTEENIARNLELLRLTHKERRTPIAEVLPVATSIVELLAGLPGVERAEACGSLRRFLETIGDLDIVVATDRPEAVMDAFVRAPIVGEVLGHGAKKSSVRTSEGLQVDVRCVAPEQLGAAQAYFTGSKTHNIRLRDLALRRGMTLNEYGLFELETDRLVASRTEEEIYAALGLPYIEPPLREDAGEVEAALAGELPVVVQLGDLTGDLHVHTDLSGDGRAGLEEMLEAAHARGLRYVAITDHGENLRLNGVPREALRRQAARLRELQARYPDMRLFHGAELNIGPEGELDYDEDFLAELDWCVARVHHRFELDREAQTRRLLRAMRHPAVNAIGHLTGRKIGRRPGISLDVDAVLQTAVETGTAIEVNCHLDRLDAPADVVRIGAGRDVTFVIDTDAHDVREQQRQRYGVAVAQRGWLTAEQVANTWEPERFLDWCRRKRASSAS
jgi:DNA polymerase (family X)